MQHPNVRGGFPGVFPEKWALPLSAAGQRLLLDQNPGNAAAAVDHAQLGAVKRQFPELGPTLQQVRRLVELWYGSLGIVAGCLWDMRTHIGGLSWTAQPHEHCRHLCMGD